MQTYSNLTFLVVDDLLLRQPYEFIKKYRLDPRDAIPLSCAFVNGIFTLVSDDGDFDTVKEVERWGVEKRFITPH